MRAATILAVLLVLAPAASAQAPDPEALVRAACDVVGTVDGDVEDALPLCPQEEPPAPTQPQAAGTPEDETPHAHEAPDETAAALAEEAQEAVEDVLADPPSAPDRLMGLAATLVQLVKDLLGIPPALGAEAYDVLVEGATRLMLAATATRNALADLAYGVTEAGMQMGEVAVRTWRAAVAWAGSAWPDLSSPSGIPSEDELRAAPSDTRDLVDEIVAFAAGRISG